MELRFGYPKEERICFGCKDIILKRDACVQVFYYSQKRDKDWYVFYHKDCYNRHQTDYVNNWFLQHPYQKPKMGRKVKRTAPVLGTRYGKLIQTETHKERRRLKALLRYHKKRGNEVRVNALSEEIKKLEAYTV